MATEMNVQKPILGAKRVYTNTGKYFHSREQFKHAKTAYDQAYIEAPDDIDVLVSRSRLYTDCFHGNQAVKDATDALAIDPKSCAALRALAGANYSMLEFEKSLTLNHRGLRRRTKPSYFRTGVNEGLACINNTIGENAGDIMRHYLPTIKQYSENLNFNAQEPVEIKHVSRIPRPETSTETKTPLEKRRQNLKSRVLGYTYLDLLVHDKFFLQDLVKNPALKSASKQSSKKLKDLAEEALQTINERQDTLHAQCFYYTIQQLQKSESKHLNEHKNLMLRNERTRNEMHAEHLLHKIHICIYEHRIDDMLKNAKNMQIFLDKKTNRTLPRKDDHTDHLYRLVGDGYLSEHRLSHSHDDAYNRRRVAFLMGLKTGRSKSHNFNPQRYAHPKEALQNAMDALTLVENANMKCWLYYEISQIQLILKNYPLARFYAHSCQKVAQELHNPVWWLNGCFSLISTGIQNGNQTDVKQLTEEAYEWAAKIGKSAEIQEFLLHCMDLANEVATSDREEHAEKRKENILRAIHPDLRTDAKLLFRKIDSVPESRRFTVLPQKIDKSETGRTRYQQKHLSIIPGPAKPLSHISCTPVPGRFKIL